MSRLRNRLNRLPISFANLIILLLLTGALIIGAATQGFPAMFGDIIEDIVIALLVVFVIIYEMGRRTSRNHR